MIGSYIEFGKLGEKRKIIPFRSFNVNMSFMWEGFFRYGNPYGKMYNGNYNAYSNRFGNIDVGQDDTVRSSDDVTFEHGFDSKYSRSNREVLRVSDLVFTVSQVITCEDAGGITIKEVFLRFCDDKILSRDILGSNISLSQGESAYFKLNFDFSSLGNKIIVDMLFKAFQTKGYPTRGTFSSEALSYKNIDDVDVVGRLPVTHIFADNQQGFTPNNPYKHGIVIGLGDTPVAVSDNRLENLFNDDSKVLYGDMVGYYFYGVGNPVNKHVMKFKRSFTNLGTTSADDKIIKEVGIYGGLRNEADTGFLIKRIVLNTPIEFNHGDRINIFIYFNMIG